MDIGVKRPSPEPSSESDAKKQRKDSDVTMGNNDTTWDGAKSANPDSIRGIESRSFDAKGFRVGIVAARWNAKCVDTLVAGALKSFRACGVEERNIIVERVAGKVGFSIVNCLSWEERERES